MVGARDHTLVEAPQPGCQAPIANPSEGPIEVELEPSTEGLKRVESGLLAIR